MIDMIHVQGGEFRRGGSENILLKNTRPVHTVIVSSFLISKYQISTNEWTALFPNHGRGDPLDDTLGDHPATMVSWLDAINYCNRLSKHEGLLPCYRIEETEVTCNFHKNGFRLPTEAEWEYTARGGAVSKAFVYSGSDILNEVGWYKGNSTGSTHKRGLKKPNELGIFDMSGNVWEWCWDWYGAYSAGTSSDPRGPDEGDRRVYRGGSWVDFDYACSVAARGGRPPDRGFNDIGFRVARSIVMID